VKEAFPPRSGNSRWPGAEVFAAGAFSIATAVRLPPVKQMVENLWERLANDRVRPAA
jgi:hypothetical protein